HNVGIVVGRATRTAQDLIQSPLPNPIEHQLGAMVGESWRHTLIEPCTRLWNSEGISMIAEIALANARRDAHNACIAMIELPRYTQINTALGHAGGDQILRRLARSMLSELDIHDSIGMADRDQFVLVMNHIHDTRDAHKRIARFQKAAESFQIEGIQGRPLMGARTSAAYIPAGSPAQDEHLFDRLREALRDPDPQPASAIRFIEPAGAHCPPQEQVA
ncbi:MAG: diguanylate cyclase, partial [Phycisphaerales bacterium]